MVLMAPLNGRAIHCENASRTVSRLLETTQILLPSGDHAGSLSLAGPCVILFTADPSAAIR